MWRGISEPEGALCLNNSKQTFFVKSLTNHHHHASLPSVVNVNYAL